MSKSVADPFGPHHEMTRVATILRQEVELAGILSFARFMEVALYCPGIGYYERHTGQMGSAGDYYTSTSVGPLFGELLARRVADWLEELSPGPLQLAEAGAHDGQLAHDILSWLAAHRPQLFARIHYWIIEPSFNRQDWQRLKLESFAPRVEWFAGFHALPASGLRGVILSNELMDAFPVHRVAWGAASQRWFEWGVGREGGRFVWRPMESGADWTAHLADAGFDLPLELLAVLPDGFVLEVSPAAGAWWSAAARSLRAGRLLTADYGLTAIERLGPGRAGGTLRVYSRHRAQADVLDNPGEQDITAHVNFSQLQRVGERAGLRTDGLFTQAEFLTQIATRTSDRDGRGLLAEAWTPAQARQFQTLVHPEHLGRAFRVLVQSR
ncbi:MAG TPA: SAM-dependent methyltransferase [Verrucomicrobiae bacterium]|nr:SAM-dependent methyltransferase [Verrucomicrobiae bacterium]